MRSEITNRNNNSNTKNCEKEWKKHIAFVGQYKSLIYTSWKSQKEERKRKGGKSLFNVVNENNIETVNLGREVNIQIHEAQKTQNKLNIRKSSPRHIVIHKSNI